MTILKKIFWMLRIIALYVSLATTATLWCTLSFFVAPFLSYRTRYRFVVKNWCGCGVWLAKVLVSIKYDVQGIENIPESPCVILAKHQSTWETFFLSSFFEPSSQVVKRSLLYIPFFGWAMSMLKPIGLDRSNPKVAFKQLAEQGKLRLEQNIWVLIFPEGTRMPIGVMGRFGRGGAALAANSQKQVLPIAHNAAQFWPKAGWNKNPGTITLIIGKSLTADDNSPQSIKDLNDRAFQWISQTQATIE